MDIQRARDEIICSVKGYFQNESVQCQLLLICQNGRWVINREETQESPTEPVSFLNESLEHSFFNSQGKDFREIWHVNWSVIEKRGNAPKNWVFRSFHAVEARSLDRGLRIVKNELNSSSLDTPEMSAHLLSGSSTRVFNHYTVEPQFLSHCKKTETVSSVTSPKTPQKHCPTCGKKYKLNRRSRCWARFSSMLCCTSDFDSLT